MTEKDEDKSQIRIFRYTGHSSATSVQDNPLPASVIINSHTQVCKKVYDKRMKAHSKEKIPV